MLDEQPLTLAHPLVQAAKAKWDTAGNITRRKHNASFEDWLEYFKSDCVRFEAIGDEVGLTRERVRQIYNDHFCELFEGKSGRERVQACTLESRHVKTKRSESELFENDPVVRVVVEKARAVGCRVSAVPTLSEGVPTGSVWARRVLVNGHLCSLHRLQQVWSLRATCRRYAHASVSLTTLAEVGACIFHVTLENLPVRTFVIPSLDLQSRKRGSGPKKAAASIYFPTEKLPTNPQGCKGHDWWQYEDAWHLLPTKE